MPTLTCIVGWVGDFTRRDRPGGIAADSLGSNGWTCNVRKDSKVFRLYTSGTQDMLVGITGTFRFGQLLMTMMPPADELACPFQYLVRVFVPEVRKLMREGGHLRKLEEVETISGDASALILYRRRLFGLCSTLQISETQERFDAIGAGYQLAIGAMAASGPKPNKRDAIRAIRIASKFCVSVRPPIRVLTSSQ